MTWRAVSAWPYVTEFLFYVFISISLVSNIRCVSSITCLNVWVGPGRYQSPRYLPALAATLVS